MQVKIKALMQRKPKSTELPTMGNEKYKILCKSSLNQEIKEIKQRYEKSAIDAVQFVVH